MQYGAGDPELIDIQDDEERLKHAHVEGMYVMASITQIYTTLLNPPFIAVTPLAAGGLLTSQAPMAQASKWSTTTRRPSNPQAAVVRGTSAIAPPLAIRGSATLPRTESRTFGTRSLTHTSIPRIPPQLRKHLIMNDHVVGVNFFGGCTKRP
jgi:hypothetical protein